MEALTLLLAQPTLDLPLHLLPRVVTTVRTAMGAIALNLVGIGGVADDPIQSGSSALRMSGNLTYLFLQNDRKSPRDCLQRAWNPPACHDVWHHQSAHEGE